MKSRNILKFFVVIAGVAIPYAPSVAADFNSCSVVEVVLAGQQNAHIQLDCEIQPRPGCAIAGNYFGFDKSTEEGRQYLSVVLTAYASNSKLTGYVTDTLCATHQ